MSFSSTNPCTIHRMEEPEIICCGKCKSKDIEKISVEDLGGDKILSNYKCKVCGHTIVRLNYIT